MDGLSVDGDGERAKNRENGGSWPPPRIQHRRSKRHVLYIYIYIYSLLFLLLLFICYLL
jgi:hypothetical protein